jgi:hypothetical protein
MTKALKMPSLTILPKVGILHASSSQRKEHWNMAKSLEMIVDVIRNTKHPFRQVSDRPDKPHKSRYERRKVKQFIHLGDWIAETRPQI